MKHSLVTLLVVFNTVFTLVVNAQIEKWSTHFNNTLIFSSPRFTDINQDGTQDIIIGGGNEFSPTENGILAINGKNGAVLWKCAAPTQIYTSALFQDLNKDGVDDVFIGGRTGQFYALDGKTGNPLWKFWNKGMKYAQEAGISNFCGVQFIPDQNNDSIKELLLSNGGDPSAIASNRNRPRGFLCVVDGKTGTILAKDQLPEHREIYYAPHLHYNYGQDSATILFGTGGEAIDGKLWEVSLSELMHNDISKARVLLSDSVKGFIVSSVLTDVNNDGLLDIINARINSGVSLVDGKTKTTVWEQFFPSFESYTSPTVGQFTGDETMDVFVLNAHGTFPNYDFFNGAIIDGKSGEIVYNDYAGLMQFASALSADVNADGFDEIIYVQNHFDPISESASCQVMVFDFHNLNTYCLGPVFEGTVFSSTPSLIDINNDGIFEFVFAHSNSFMSRKVFSEVTLLELEWKNLKPTYPCFLGPEGNGVIQK
jgi:outer membrane protein assembly factor BamB